MQYNKYRKKNIYRNIEIYRYLARYTNVYSYQIYYLNIIIEYQRNIFIYSACVLFSKSKIS